MIPVRLRFPFELQFIPKRGRRVRTGSFYGDGCGLVRRADPAEVSPAFRLHFPSEASQKVFTIELIYFDERVWWPLPYFSWIPFAHLMSADKFIEELANGDCDILGVGKGPVREMPLIRTFMRSNHDEVLASVQRKLSDNILLCGDTAYAVGGEPAYIQIRYRSSWEMTVASIAPDRSVDPTIGGIRVPPGYFAHQSVQRAFQYGHFQLADERHFAEKLAARSIPIHTMPWIEILMPGLPRVSRDQIRLDALFRCALDRRTDWYSWAHEERDSKTFFACRSDIADVAAQDPAAPTTTQDRFDVLDNFVSCADEGGALWRMSVHFRRLRRNFRSLAESATLTGFWGETRRGTASRPAIPDEWLAGLS